MKILVLGAGMMGSAIVYDLARSPRVQQIAVGDVDGERAARVAQTFGSSKTSPVVVDVRDAARAVEVMRESDVAVSAVTLHYNDVLARAALDARTNFCDLGGSDDIVAKQKMLDPDAKRIGVTLVVNCGLAPGMANVIAMHGVKQFDRVRELRIRVGGLPQRPKPPLDYQLVFSVDGLIKEYTERAKVLRQGRVEYVEPLTEIEPVEFPQPFGSLEAFHTGGGASLLPELLRGKVDSLDYKTIRYRGHAERMKTLFEVGFTSTEPISLGEHITTPRELFEALLKKKLPSNEPDVVLMRITVRGVKEGIERTVVRSMVDRFDEKTCLTAMMRTTAFPTSIIAQMIGSGEINMKGVYTPEECVPAEPFIAELRRRNIIIEEMWS
jgi:lysine 6-dehydrogenase